MAEPKKRTNKSKTGMRRMHIHAASVAINYCSNCHEATPRHQVCPSCGYYKGEKLIEKTEKKVVSTEEENK